MKRRLQPRQARWLCSKLLAVLQVLSGAPCKAHFLRGMARHGVLLHIFGAETASTNLSPPPTKSPSRRDADLQLDFVPGMHLEPPQCALCWSFCTSTVCAHPGVKAELPRARPASASPTLVKTEACSGLRPRLLVRGMLPAAASLAAPTAPAIPGPPAVFERGGWQFEAAATPLWPSTRIDELARDLGLCKVPDMFCGDASLRISHAHSGICLKLCAIDALQCCRWRPPPPLGLQPPPRAVSRASGGDAGPQEADEPMLGAVRCQFAEHWKPLGDNPDVRELKVSSDWTCSSPYWGTYFRGREIECLDDEEWAEAAEEPLPMDLLRRRDEIHWYHEVLFWEDELDDNGICRLGVRVRVMPTFWFALLLCELRVDNVLIREVATRFFCTFGSDNVLREWTWKEATYEALRSRGVRLSDCPQVSQTSIGTTLLEQGDVRQQLRHKLLLKPANTRGAAEHFGDSASL